MTRQHSDRVATISHAMAERRGWGDERVRLLHEAALLHDIGKIGVPDSILLKPGPLTGDEYARVQEHAPLGAMIVEGLFEPEQVEWVRWHHERPDGGGYPDGLSDPAIPEGAAIIGLADAWDVMTASRPYRSPIDPQAAMRECLELRGRQFRPDLVDTLAEVI